MKAINAFTFLVTLLVAAMCWITFAFDPTMLVSTPWGRIHAAFLFGGAYALGAGIISLYLFSSWGTYQAGTAKKNREVKTLQAEIDRLKSLHIEEIPIIPDRDSSI